MEHYRNLGILAQLARTMNNKGIAKTLVTTLNEGARTRIGGASIHAEASAEESGKST